MNYQCLKRGGSRIGGETGRFMSRGRWLRRATWAAVALVAGLPINGCLASAARPVAMTARPEVAPKVATTDRGFEKVRVADVTGGAETHFYSGPNVSNEQLRIALESSLRQAGYFAANPALASVAVTVNLVSLDAPQFSISSSVNSVMHYQAVNTTNGEMVFNDTIRALARKGPSDAFIGVTRRRLANEESIRANIETFLQRFREVFDKRPGKDE